jgi:hypothetical protein
MRFNSRLNGSVCPINILISARYAMIIDSVCQTATNGLACAADRACLRPWDQTSQIGSPATLTGWASVLNTQRFFPIRIRNLPLGVLVRMNQVCVLEHFGEEERLLEIGERTAVGSVNIGNGAVSATNTSGVDDCFEARERPLSWGY